MARRKQSVRPRGKTMHKGARGQTAKTKKSKAKTKARTATRHARKGRQKVAMQKATAPADNSKTEAAPADVEERAERTE